MDQNQDFAALRNLLALKKLETPMDTDVNRFLIEFHRRQRAQLLVPASPWSRLMGWLEDKAAGFQLAPSLSYGAAFAAIAIMAVVGLSQQVQVSPRSSGGYQLSLHMPASQSSFAMIPATLSTQAPAKASNSLTFTPTRADAAPTRFVLANNAHPAYDANVAF